MSTTATATATKELPWIVRRSVRGASTIHEDRYATRAEAEERAARWRRSNADGDYWAKVVEADGYEGLSHHERALVLPLALVHELERLKDRYLNAGPHQRRDLTQGAAVATLAAYRKVAPKAAESWVTVHGHPYSWNQDVPCADCGAVGYGPSAAVCATCNPR